MAEQLETYGSAGLRVMFMDDEKGKLIKTDTLFENLYDFWTSYHDPCKIIFLGIVQKYVNLKAIFEESGNQKIFQM